MQVLQVHVMVTSAGHDPCLTRTLQEAAEALSGLHAVHSPSLSPLLPEVVKLEKQDAAVEPAAVRILGGSLASNNKGGLLWILLCLQCVSWLQMGCAAQSRKIFL